MGKDISATRSFSGDVNQSTMRPKPFGRMNKMTHRASLGSKFPTSPGNVVTKKHQVRFNPYKSIGSGVF